MIEGEAVKKIWFALLILFIIGDSIIGITFGILFFERVGLPYNSLGRYFNAQQGVVYHEQHIPVCGLIVILAVVFFIFGVYWLIRLSGKDSKG